MKTLKALQQAGLAAAFPVLAFALCPSNPSLSHRSILSAQTYNSARLSFDHRKGPNLRGGDSRTAVMAAAVQENPRFAEIGYRRPLHWVLKIGSLENSLKFFENIFGMHVHRHEEFGSGCEATCNGPYGGAWSKTMVGYQKEDTNFALELTYNYGIDSYIAGNDLRYIAVRASAVLVDPATLGCPVHVDEVTKQKVVTGPDGYKFMMVDMDEGDQKEPFLFVSLNVENLASSLTFYEDVLGAKKSKPYHGAKDTDKVAMIFFGSGATKIELVELSAGEKVDHAQASGRFATETEDGAPAHIGNNVQEAGGTVLHGPVKLQPHNEEVVIVADPDGYEHCFVDARGYTNCMNVAHAEGGTTIDWDFRKRLTKASTSKSPKLEVAKVLARNYDAVAVEVKLKNLIENSPVTIFTQTSCPFCTKAKDVLEQKGAKFSNVDIDTLGDEGYAFRVGLHAMTGFATVPQVFIGGKLVGGFSDLEAMAKDRKLDDLLIAAGAV